VCNKKEEYKGFTVACVAFASKAGHIPSAAMDYRSYSRSV